MGKILVIIVLCLLGMGGLVPDGLFGSQHAQNTEFNDGFYVVADNGLPYVIQGSAIAQGTAGNGIEAIAEDVEAGGVQTDLIDAQLLVKYPDRNGWMDYCDYGDIPYLANAAYIDKSLQDGIFYVSTPEELASFNYYVNAVSEDGSHNMQLMNDIDLAGYEWAPMGWSGGTDAGVSFSGGIWGENYTIRNLYIDSDDYSAGLIGWGVYCGVFNLTIEDAYVKGRIDAGILVGESIQGWYENCHVTGETYGDKAGSLHGYSAGEDIYDCTADVLVNGEVFPFLTWNEKERSEIVIENPLTVVLHDDYSVSYTPGEQFTNLGWQVKKDGKVVVERDSPKETYSYTDQSPGTYSICLTGFVDGQYVPVSNVVEYTIE